MTLPATPAQPGPGGDLGPASSSLRAQLVRRAWRRLLFAMALLGAGSTAVVVAGVPFPLPPLDGCVIRITDAAALDDLDSFDLSADGRLVVVHTNANRLFAWSAAMRAVEPLPLPPELTPTSFSLAADGRFVGVSGFTASGPTAVVVDRVTATTVDVAKELAPRVKPVDGIVIAPDGSAAAFSLGMAKQVNRGEVAVWSRATDTVRIVPPRDHRSADRPLRFSDDGRTLLYETVGAGRAAVRAFDRPAGLSRTIDEFPKTYGGGLTSVSSEARWVVEVAGRSFDELALRLRTGGTVARRFSNAAWPALGNRDRLLAFEDRGQGSWGKRRMTGARKAIEVRVATGLRPRLVAIEPGRHTIRQLRTRSTTGQKRLRGVVPKVAASAPALAFRAFDKDVIGSSAERTSGESLYYFTPGSCHR